METNRRGTRFLDPAIEHRFRTDSLADETRLAVAIQATWVFFFVAFASNDFVLHRGAMLASLVGVRAVIVGSGLGAIWLLRRSRVPAVRDRALLAVIAVEVVGGIYINWTRPPHLTPLFATNIIAILTCWALLPLPGRLQAVSAGVVTVGAVVTVLLKPPQLHPVEAIRLALELLLANGIGVAVSILSQRERRARWAAVRAAEEAGRALLATQRELADARLKELQSQLVQVQRAGGMGSLAVALAHELGQPLTAVRNNAFAARAYLDRTPPDVAGARSALDDVTAGAGRTAEIIQRTRDYLRRGEPRQERVAPARVARDAIAIVEHAARERGIELSIDVARDAPEVAGDAVQFVQVAVIALANALDAAGSAPSPRRVRLWARGQGGGLEMGVDDSGPGFAPTVRERLFDPFFTTKAEGMGMGLPIARTIVEAHGGAIAADAAPGGGARIAWFLPVGDGVLASG